MRTTAATLLFGCLAAVPVSAKGQTSILPPTATLNDPAVQREAPRLEGPRGETLAVRHEGGSPGRGAEHGGERGGEPARRGEGRPPHGRTCLAQAEARETVAARRLVDPVRALRFGRQQGDALNAKLCRWPPEEFVYEIDVLRRDGRLLRLFMNAQSGEAVTLPSQAVQAGARIPDQRSPDPRSPDQRSPDPRSPDQAQQLGGRPSDRER